MTFVPRSRAANTKPMRRSPEPELSAEYSVSRITVRRAVEELCAEGYLVKMQGRGTFVSKPRIHRKFTSGRNAASFTETCKENGMVPGARLLNRQIVPVRKDEEAFFHVGPEALLIYIQRLRTADGQPVFLENLFLPYEPYKNLMSENLNDVSMFDTIERISGLRPATTSCQRIEAGTGFGRTGTAAQPFAGRAAAVSERLLP